MKSTRRPVVLYLGLLVATILLGLATRRFPSVFPELIARFGGDALWAAMMLWLVALWRRAAAPHHVALAALAVAWTVEFSQLYQAPWIVAVRATRGGALVLGQGFLWSDLVSYAVGVMLAAALDAGIVGAARAAQPRAREGA
jgi:Protein of unknown function (DUF2809)